MNDTVHLDGVRLLDGVGAACAVASAGYGIWVAVFYDGGTAPLLPFAAIACLGAVLALVGAVRSRSWLLGLGMALQVASPTGFAWPASLAIGACGLGMLAYRAVRTRSGRNAANGAA